MVNIIKEAVNSGLTQNQACLTFGLSPRKFRRWANPKPVKPRTAWNKILPQEHEAIKNAVYVPELLDKPLSHVFVHGHDTGKFFASLSTVFRVLKSENLVKPLGFYRTKKTNYVSAHALMKEGFSLLCYDATQLKTEAICRCLGYAGINSSGEIPVTCRLLHRRRYFSQSDKNRSGSARTSA